MKLFLVLLVMSLHVALAVADEPYEAGRRAANAGRFSEALAIWQPLAAAGNADAQFGLGRMYARGDGVPQDFGKAFQYVEQAAQQGHKRAQGMLSIMYSRGDGVRRDIKEADYWRGRSLKPETENESFASPTPSKSQDERSQEKPQASVPSNKLNPPPIDQVQGKATTPVPATPNTTNSTARKSGVPKKADGSPTQRQVIAILRRILDQRRASDFQGGQGNLEWVVRQKLDPMTDGVILVAHARIDSPKFDLLFTCLPESCGVQLEITSFDSDFRRVPNDPNVPLLIYKVRYGTHPAITRFDIFSGYSNRLTIRALASDAYILKQNEGTMEHLISGSVMHVQAPMAEIEDQVISIYFTNPQLDSFLENCLNLMETTADALSHSQNR